MSIPEIAPWVVAGLFAVLYIIEHARNAFLTRDCMNRLQSRDLREYAALRPILSQERPVAPQVKPERAARRPNVVDEDQVEAVIAEAREAWNSL